MRLGQIRRRLRLQAAVEGAVLGATIVAAALAVGLAIARARGQAADARGATLNGLGLAAPVVVAVLAVLLGALAGAAARAARRIPLDRCARLADAALDGQDRLLSALHLEVSAPSAFARALCADAVRRAEALLPRAAVPPRRPAGLRALGVAALALAGAAVVPASSSAARIAAPAGNDVAARRAPLPAGALDGERDAAAAAMAEAARLGDARLTALAAELDRTLRRLAAGTLGDRAALDLLRALAARAGEAARDARRDAQTVEAAARALAANAETRAAGQAIAPPGGEAADEARAADALAASAVAHPAETARALAAAAETVANAAAGSSQTGDDADAPGQRRLARDDKRQSAGEVSGSPAATEPAARHLERLRRDLDDAATACRSGDPTCGTRAGERGRDLAQMERQGAAGESLRSVERTAEQLRARIGRGELGSGDAQALRSFGQAARGTPGGGERDQARDGDGEGRRSTDAPGSKAQARGESDDGSGAGQAGADGPGRGRTADTGAASALLGVAGSDRSGAEAAGTGNGIGHQPGGPPLGARAAAGSDARSEASEVPLADGAGPSRAEVIGTAAGHGFASRGYARAYADYAAAVEDALAAAAVPDGKRFLVRRYFDLIRPRTSTRAPGGRP